MENSKIEWTDHTFNPWWGCMKVSDGCKNCYAETLDNRWNKENPHWGPNSERKGMSDNYWKQPLKWDAEAKKAGVKAKVFCASMADVFEDNDQVFDWRYRLYDLIDNTPNLIWQLLTKRPENIPQFAPYNWGKDGWPDNVWIGTSVENQKAADERIIRLLEVPAKVRFLSCEPLLGSLNLKYWLKPIFCSWVDDAWNQGYKLRGIDWVIVGGESGHGARPMHPDWVRTLFHQCKAANVPFFFKQWGEYLPFQDADVIDEYDSRVVEFPSPYFPDKMNQYLKLGKKQSGSKLIGQEYKEFPNAG